MEIKEIIKNTRIALNKSQQEFADSLNVTQHALSQYENGKRNIPNDILEKIFSMKKINDLKTNSSPHAYLEHLFPSWESENTGGWNMIMSKDLQLKNHQNKIKVTVSPYGIGVFKKLNKHGNPILNEHANLEEYNSNSQLYYDFMENSEVMLLSYEDLIDNEKLYTDLFEVKDTIEIKKIIEELRNI